MTAEIQHLTPLIGGLYGLYVALGMWDGATRRIVSMVSAIPAKLGAKSGWEAELAKAIEEEGGFGGGSESSVETARCAYDVYDDVTSATRHGQNICFIIAAFYALVLLFAGGCPEHELPLLSVMIIGLSLTTPIGTTVFLVRRHWRRWEERKDDAASGPGADAGDEYDEPQKP